MEGSLFDYATALIDTDLILFFHKIELLNCKLVLAYSGEGPLQLKILYASFQQILYQQICKPIGRR